MPKEGGVGIMMLAHGGQEESSFFSNANDNLGIHH
jgi:hypothetical protein